jgi:sugar diacid utilization regulator
MTMSSLRPGPPAVGGTGLSLQVVVASLGPQVVTVVDAGAGLEREAVDAVLFDPVVPVPPGALVLGVGLEPGTDAYLQALDAVTAAGAVALAVKAVGGASRELLVRPFAVGAARPALLEVTPGMAWDQFYALLRSSLSAARAGARPAADVGPRAVPLGDLFALTNATAAAVGGPVLVEDMQLRVLAYSSVAGQTVDDTRQRAILGQQAPDRPHNAELYRRLFRQGGVLRNHAEGELPRVAVPISVGGEHLGSIWVVDADGQLSPDTDDLLLDVARIAALHLLHARAADNVERELRADLLGGLFEGRLAPAAVAARLGLAPAGPHVVVAFEPRWGAAGSQGADAEHTLLRLAQLTGLRLEAQRRHAAAVVLGHIVYAVVPVPPEGGADGGGAQGQAVRALVERVVADARQALRVEVCAAIGPVVPTLAEAARSRREADLVLSVLDPGAGDPVVASADALRHRVVLAELARLTDDHPWLFAGAAQEIARYDAEKHTEYGPTLHAFLDCFGDSAAAASLVRVHPNTLRYRLRRIREIFGVDLEDADTRLVLALEARLRRR